MAIPGLSETSNSFYNPADRAEQFFELRGFLQDLHVVEVVAWFRQSFLRFVDDENASHRVLLPLRIPQHLLEGKNTIVAGGCGMDDEDVERVLPKAVDR